MSANSASSTASSTIDCSNHYRDQTSLRPSEVCASVLKRLQLVGRVTKNSVSTALQCCKKQKCKTTPDLPETDVNETSNSFSEVSTNCEAHNLEQQVSAFRFNCFRRCPNVRSSSNNKRAPVHM